MANKSPKERMEDLETVLEAWKELAPDKKFGGFTVAEYEAQVGKSRSDRHEVTEADINLTSKQNKRDATDLVGLDMRKLVVYGIIGDKDFGPNSTLYERCGYVREEDRKSGLTRKKKDGDK